MAKVKKYLDEIIYSNYFIGLVAVIVALSWVTECEYIAGIFTVLVVPYILLTSDRLDAVVPFLIVFPALVYKEMKHRLYTHKIVLGTIIAIIIVASLVYFVIKNRKKAYRKLTESKVLGAMMLFLAAIMLGGIGYAEHSFKGFLLASLVGFGFVAIYVLLFRFCKSNLVETVAYSLIALGLVMAFQTIFTIAGAGDVTDFIVSKQLDLGWAITNSVACVFAMIIPLCFYFSYKKPKWVWAFQSIAFLFFALIFVTNCRSMMVVGSAIYALCLLVSVIKMPSLQLFCCLVVFAGLGTLAAIKFGDTIFSQFKYLGLDSNGRKEQYEWYVSAFKDNPIFGIGVFSDTVFQPDHIVRVHNSALQILTSFGIVGMAFYAVYFARKVQVLVTGFNPYKLFVIVSYLAFIGYGLIDTAFISSYKQMFIILLLLSAELQTHTDYTKFAKGWFPNKQKQANAREQVVDFVPYSPVVYEFNIHWFYKNYLKRFLDVALSLIAIILLSPLLIVVAIMVRVKNGKPILFGHCRVGKNGKIFMFKKFRSMTNERDENGDLLPDYMRLNKFGRFIRKTSVDELPQLFIVLFGKMSIIGPRPRAVAECVFLTPEQFKRHDITPGITGWAQVNGRNSITFDKVCELDNYYVKHCSLLLDIKILYKTVMCVFKKSNIDGAVESVHQNEYHGDYLLRTGKITKEYYDEKIAEAKAIEHAFNKKEA